MKSPTPTATKPATDPSKAAASPAAAGDVSAAALAAVAGTAAPAPGLSADDPLRDPAVPAGAVAPTLDPDAPDLVPARELPGEVINAGLDRGQALRDTPGAGLEIGAQAPGRDATSGSTDGVVGRGTLIETDRTEFARQARLQADDRHVDDADRARAEVFEPAILVSCAHSRRRAGFAFGPTPVRVLLNRLSREQVRAIEDDPLLTIRRA